LRPCLINQSDGGWEQVPFILVPKLLACLREGWAWDPAGQKVDALEGSAVECVQILLEHLPGGAIRTQGRTGMLVQFNESDMVEFGPFKAQGLAPGASAQF